MPSSGADLHINQALTTVSVAYFQDEKNFVADQVFPSIPVSKRSDLYNKYSKSDFRRSDAQKRARGTKSAKINWRPSQDNYHCDVFAVSDDIHDQDRANADSNWDLEADSTRAITSHLLIQKDTIWADTYFKTGVWDVEKTGVASAPSAGQFIQWDDSGSDPLTDQTDWATDFKLSTGFDMNFMVVGADVWKALKNHAAILDRIKYTQKGVVTKDLVAEYFDVEKLLVAYSSSTDVPEINDAATQDAAATYDWIVDSKGILFGYAPARPGLKVPSAGYTFNWKGYGAGNKYGLTIRQFRDETIRADTIEGEAAYTMKKVSGDCGVFCNDAVS